MLTLPKRWLWLISLFIASGLVPTQARDGMDYQDRLARLDAFVGFIGKTMCKKDFSDFQDGYCSGLFNGLKAGMSISSTRIPVGRTYLGPDLRREAGSEKDREFMRGHRRGVVDALVEKYYFLQRLDYGASALAAQRTCDRETIHRRAMDLIAEHEDFQKNGIHRTVLAAIEDCHSVFDISDLGFFRPFTIPKAEAKKLEPVLDPYLGLYSLHDEGGNAITGPIFTVFRPATRYAVAATGRKQGVLAMDGTWLVPPLFVSVKPNYSATLECGQRLSEDEYYRFRYASVMNDEGKWGYIDNRGKLLIDYFYDRPFGFTGGIASVYSGPDSGWIDINGRPVAGPCPKNSTNKALVIGGPE